jgi:Large polyvalent protein-associated domain 7
VMSATAIIALAQQRGWSSVRVRGSQAFRRAVWTAAAEHGMQVFGYSPTRGESAVLAQSASPDGHPARPSGDAKRAAAGRAHDPSLTGVLIDMGEAPYRHERTNAESFFVTLRDADGKAHTHWGVGLRKAIEQAGVTPGQRVALERLGKESVQVKRPVLDEKGDVSYRKTEVVERRLWGVRVLDPTPEAPPAAADTPTPRRASADPELAKALALIEQRMPQLPEALRLELRRHFDTAYARLSKPAARNATERGQTAQSNSRSARGR